MSDSGSHRVADTLIAFSAGLVVGVAGALLLAPASGRDTRRRIGEFAGDVKERAGGLVDRATSAVKDQASRLEHAFVEGKQAYREEPNRKPTI